MLMQYAAIFDGNENDTFRIKNIFSYFCSKHRSLLGTRRRFLTRVSTICIITRGGGGGIKKFVGRHF